jgi:hypothetical protein
MSATHPSAAQPSDAQPAAAAPESKREPAAEPSIPDQPGAAGNEVSAARQAPAEAPSAVDSASASAAEEEPSGGPQAEPQTQLPADKPMRLGRLRTLLAIGVGLVVLVLVGSAVGAWAFTNALHASYPQTSGTLKITGLSAPVTVQRDSNGIPQIYAQTSADLFLAEGYVQAQDRFWQMDVDRHVTSGTLSSMLGSSALSTDEFVRTLGWRTVAEQSYAQLKPETKAYLQAYSQGINDYIAAHPGGSSLSIEYTIIGAPLFGTVSDYRRIRIRPTPRSSLRVHWSDQHTNKTPRPRPRCPPPRSRSSPSSPSCSRRSRPSSVRPTRRAAAWARTPGSSPAR